VCCSSAAEPKHSHAWDARETESCAASFREILHYVMLFRYQRSIRQLRRHHPRGITADSVEFDDSEAVVTTNPDWKRTGC
jgi:hypothetical protein